MRTFCELKFFFGRVHPGYIYKKKMLLVLLLLLWLGAVAVVISHFYRRVIVFFTRSYIYTMFPEAHSLLVRTYIYSPQPATDLARKNEGN